VVKCYVTLWENTRLCACWFIINRGLVFEVQVCKWRYGLVWRASLILYIFVFVYNFYNFLFGLWLCRDAFVKNNACYNYLKTPQKFKTKWSEV
jgi:hypothetical protein